MVGKAKQWFPNDKATNEWLNSYKKSSRHTYLTAWKYFVEFTGMTGDQIKQDREADKEYRWEKKLIEFRRWMIEQKKLSEHTAVSSAGAVRSFFAYHRMELKFRRLESVRLTEAKRKYEDYRFNKENLKAMADVSDLEEEYVVVVGKSFGLRAGDFLKLTRGDLEPYIDRPVPISIGKYDTQKESAPAYPFIDSDAQPVIKRMFVKMNSEGRTDSNERMLTYKNTIQLTYVLKRVAKRAGIKHGNKVVRFHCLRKFLIDHISSHMSTEKWKQIVGKKINEKAYVSPDSLRSDYQRAMVETTFAKTLSEQEIEVRSAKQTLETLARIANIPENVRKKIMRSVKLAKTTEELEVVEEVLKKAQQQTATNGGGLSFELQARKTLADILVGAVQDTKKRLAEDSR